jgi:ATP-dependent RNA helicase DHX36
VPELAAHASEAIVQCTQRGRDGEDNRGGGAMPLQLIAELVDYLHSSRIGADNGSGAILVFLPGWSEISAVLRSLEGRRSMQGSTLVIPLHGNLQGSTQRQVFERPRAGIRKIILSTNIAETSLTIDDATFVIDSARKKEKGYDASTRMASLLPVWVSRDSLQQRRGRAGRVARGVCFHLLTSEQEAQLAQHDVPEMLRTPLEELCLATIQLKLGKVKSVLARTPEPPERAAVTDAMDTLRRLGALRDGTESLTALGRHLVALSTEPRFGKLLLLGSMMGCVDPLLTIVSCLANRDPFITVPQDKRREADVAKLQLAQSEEALRGSDHLLLLAVSEKYDAISRRRGDRAAGDWCREQFISQSALQMASRLRSQFSDQLGRCGFESMRGRGSGGGASASDRQKQMDLVRALIGVVLTPDIVWVVPAGDGRSPPCYDRLNNEIALAAGSVALHADPSGSSNGGGGGKPAAMFLVYGDQIKTERAVRRSSLTSVPPLALLLLGTEPPVLRPDPDATGGKGLLVTSATCPALRFRLPSAKAALLLEELRSAWLCMVDAVRKTPLFAPFIYKNDHFTKTGSGQT